MSRAMPLQGYSGDALLLGFSVALISIGLIAIAAYFGGPTIIGLLAEVSSLPVAFAFPVLLYMVVGLQSKYIKVRELKQ